MKGEEGKGGQRSLLFAVLAFSLLLSSCGFHLRGAPVLPEVMARTYVTGGDGSELYYEVENALLNAGAEVVDSADSASAVLILHSQRLERRVLSVDPEGRAAEYELVLALVFSLRDQAGGRVLADNQRVSVVRDFGFDPDNVLAKGDEEAMLRSEMYRFAVAQMMRQLQSLARRPAAATGGE